ncbi:MAG TPA: type II secretion system protein [Tepidisphaeraceae bacterium]|jgi:type II secretory pathway pseudopilin PulG
MSARSRAFALIELLTVIIIIALLLAMLFPALRRARLAYEQVACASNLRQIGAALLTYVNDHHQQLPFVVEPLWKTNGTLDFTADPFDFSQSPQSLPAVVRPYVKAAQIFTCPSATLGYPSTTMQMSYRVSSANNYDGQIRTEEQLLNPGGTPQYAYSLKYLNGRKYRLRYVNATVLPFALSSGVGPFYLARDFVQRESSGQFHPPHRQNYNQLRLDLSVSLERETAIGFTYP